MSELLVNTIKKADGTGSITVPADTGTLLTSGASAIDFSSIDVSGIPVTNEFAQYIRNFGGSVDGTATSSTSWNTVYLNAEVSDTIGASIGTAAAYAITLPAGTYFVMGGCQTYKVGRSGARLIDTTLTTTLMTGGSNIASNASNGGGFAYISGQMTLASSTDFYFQVYSNDVGNLGMRPADGSSWQQSYLNIWKIA